MAKKIGIIVLLCFSLCVGGVSAFANEGHDETDTQTLIETQPPVSSVLFRQDGADIQQSTDEGKTWQSYSPIEETDYFTYDEFSAWIENETENIQKLVDAGEWTEAEATEALEYYDEILKSILEGKMVGKRASSSDDQLFFSMPDNAQAEQYQTFVFDGNTYKSIICNLTYTGVLRSGESRSQTLPHLQIIEQELFEAAQHIRTSRANSAEQERRVPLNTRGQSLLAGNVFCGHCGSRLALTTNGKAYPCKEDAHRIVKRVRYICYGKTRKQTECDGQTGYTAHILDGIIDKVVRQIFERMKAIPKSEIVNIRYREKMEERKALLKSAKSDYAKAAAELDTLRAEVIKSLRGESAFSQDLLGSLISDCETKCLEVQHTMEAAQAAYDEGQAMLDALNAQYDDIISWADMYDSASTESKKMIVSCLIRRVEVYRDYRLHIDFNIDFEQFSAGLDISAIAA